MFYVQKHGWEWCPKWCVDRHSTNQPLILNSLSTRKNITNTHQEETIDAPQSPADVLFTGENQHYPGEFIDPSHIIADESAQPITSSLQTIEENTVTFISSVVPENTTPSRMIMSTPIAAPRSISRRETPSIPTPRSSKRKQMKNLNFQARKRLRFHEGEQFTTAEITAMNIRIGEFIENDQNVARIQSILDLYEK